MVRAGWLWFWVGVGPRFVGYLARATGSLFSFYSCARGAHHASASLVDAREAGAVVAAAAAFAGVFFAFFIPR